MSIAGYCPVPHAGAVDGTAASRRSSGVSSLAVTILLYSAPRPSVAASAMVNRFSTSRILLAVGGAGCLSVTGSAIPWWESPREMAAWAPALLFAVLDPQASAGRAR